MKTKLLPGIICFLAFCISATAQKKLARIHDKDHYTNVREGKGTNFPVLDIVREDAFFYCENTDGDWWEVRLFEWNDGRQITGYMHKSRITLLETLPDSVQRSIIWNTFDEQVEFVGGYTGVRYSDSESTRHARRRMEDYTDKKFNPVLPFFTDYFCRTGDSVLLGRLMFTVWDSYSAGLSDDTPAFMLGDCFACRPEIFMRRLIAVDDTKERLFLTRKIHQGLFHHFPVGLNSPEYQRLRALLETAK